jgi:hypothetical protein
MGLIYSEEPQNVRSDISIDKMDGTKAYLRHYDNKLYLAFIAKNGSQTERWQAEKELVICERKMRFWEKHPNFVGEAARQGMEQANKAWRQEGRH